MSSTTENYLKRIYSVAESTDDEYVSLGTLATEMGVTPGTITTMMKSLERAGLVEYKPRTGVRLTDEGSRQALDVLRKHRLVELLLVRILGLDWSEVHEEAEELEHAVSDRLLERIDEILGRPSVDPHGDPIPDANGTVESIATTPLSDHRTGDILIVARIAHQEASFLEYAKEAGLIPGASVEVLDRREESDVMMVRAEGTETTLSLRAAEKVQVTPAAG